MKMMQKIKCKLGFHRKGFPQAAVGGRNVVRCVYCDKELSEESMMGQVTWKGNLNLSPPPRKKGKVTDSWFK